MTTVAIVILLAMLLIAQLVVLLDGRVGPGIATIVRWSGDIRERVVLGRRVVLLGVPALVIVIGLSLAPRTRPTPDGPRDAVAVLEHETGSGG